MPARTVLPPLHAWNLDAYRAPDGTLDEAKVREYAERYPGALVLGNPWREALARDRP